MRYLRNKISTSTEKEFPCFGKLRWRGQMQVNWHRKERLSTPGQEMESEDYSYDVGRGTSELCRRLFRLRNKKVFPLWPCACPVRYCPPLGDTSCSDVNFEKEFPMAKKRK